MKDISLDGKLLLEYDHGGEGMELPEWVWPRAQMPWHPKKVPLVLNLRRNVGRGVVLEGLHVRWWYVARLLRALSAYPPNGQVWRIGGQEQEPMHKFYDPRVFDVLDEKAMRSRFEDDAGISELPEVLKTAEDFAIAGFRVKVIEPEAGGAQEQHIWVEEKIFCRWLTLGGLQVSEFVASWWTGLYPQEVPEECKRAHLKTAGDDTCVELFKRICERVEMVSSDAVRDGSICLDALQRWLENELGADLLRLECGEHLREQLAFEIGLVDDLQPGVEERGCMEEDVDRADEDDQAKSLAEHLVYGWPNKAADPVTVRDAGRFVKAHPLDFPMGVGDLFDPDRPRKVRVSEWVQHLIRYKDGRFVRGLRGQRVLWAMVNELLLSEARQRGYAVYRSVRRRLGFGFQGGGVLTKGELRDMLKDEQSVRLVTNQLMCLGRDVRTSPMFWNHESKKLDAAVKHLSWCPPWVDRFVDSGDSDVEEFHDEVTKAQSPSKSNPSDAGGVNPESGRVSDEVGVSATGGSGALHPPRERNRVGSRYICKNGLVGDDVGLGRTPAVCCW